MEVQITAAPVGLVMNASEPISVQDALVIVSILGLILFTVIGNVLVMISVFVVRRLRQPSNYLLVSLAVSDTFVGVLVMPFALVYNLDSTWKYGMFACRFWTTSDVFLCTASILNLCAVSVDRYLTVTNPLSYVPKRTTKLILIYIAIVWCLSIVISILPVFAFTEPPVSQGVCQVNTSVVYQLYATMFAFYLPVLIMLVLNIKIYIAARALVDSDRGRKMTGTSIAPRSGYDTNGDISLTLPSDFDPSRRSTLKSTSEADKVFHNSPLITQQNRRLLNVEQYYQPHKKLSSFSLVSGVSSITSTFSSTLIQPFRRYNARRRSSRSDSQRDNKAAKTLTIIMTAFITCWLPFFLIALLKPFLGTYLHIPPWVDIFATWLGYLNSSINPILYVCFNRDFRVPMQQMILCRCATLQEVIRRELYAEIYGETLPPIDNSFYPEYSGGGKFARGLSVYRSFHTRRSQRLRNNIRRPSETPQSRNRLTVSTPNTIIARLNNDSPTHVTANLNTSEPVDL